jgi:hypothetical protein
MTATMMARVNEGQMALANQNPLAHLNGTVEAIDEPHPHPQAEVAQVAEEVADQAGQAVEMVEILHLHLTVTAEQRAVILCPRSTRSVMELREYMKLWKITEAPCMSVCARSSSSI